MESHLICPRLILPNLYLPQLFVPPSNVPLHNEPTTYMLTTNVPPHNVPSSFVPPSYVPPSDVPSFNCNFPSSNVQPYMSVPPNRSRPLMGSGFPDHVTFCHPAHVRQCSLCYSLPSRHCSTSPWQPLAFWYVSSPL